MARPAVSVRLTFAAWDTVVRELQEMSKEAQREADWQRHRATEEAIRCLRHFYREQQD